ncbi:hypothetical protein K3758_14735 [Sulfitobacter sp. W002]|uniref:hypothetical protein n=1 Tax=unclassified Sulfitobacter TaxID=196795 RepID=UPI0013C42E86|nr:MULTISPECIES: hypothetical protein [unclassified Sulfitobacter]UWR29588.1 hypothetical protein K3758_14735 [Sulfitobacter sp. W002]|tara:strand:- start:1967 stop:2710 length:744 start_codon:yes stop_codon:yes gene_type:complete
MLDTSDKYRIHPDPRISANQLAEYALASPSRRQVILRNAKYAPTFLVVRYGEARASVCDFLKDGTRPVAKLHSAEAELKATAASLGSKFKENDALLSAEAIASFAAFVSDPKQYPNAFSKLTFAPITGYMPKLPLSEVDVSVQVDLIAKNQAKEVCGGVLLQTSKAISAKSWRDEHSLYVTSLIWMASSEFLAGHGTVDPNLCYAVDLFGKKATKAPKSYKTRVKNLEAACGEIAAMWPNIEPPADL